MDPNMREEDADRRLLGSEDLAAVPEGESVSAPPRLGEVFGPEVPMPAAAAAADPSQRLGGCILLEELGRGPSGIVHRAWDLSLGRYVAFKQLQGPPAAALRFHRTARLLSHLAHPHLVSIYRVGEEGGTRYIVSRLIDKAVGPAATLSPRQVAEVARDAAYALQTAHELGVHHRNLKPENFLVDSARCVWLSDFGWWTDPDDRGATGGAGPGSTRETHWNAGDDVHDLAATIAVMLGHCSGRPPTTEDLASLETPDELRFAIRRAVDSRRSFRYASAAAFAADLEKFLEGIPVERPADDRPEAPSSPVRQRRVLMLLWAGAALVGLLSWFLIGGREGDPLPYRSADLATSGAGGDSAEAGLLADLAAVEARLASPGSERRERPLDLGPLRDLEERILAETGPGAEGASRLRHAEFLRARIEADERWSWLERAEELEERLRPIAAKTGMARWLEGGGVLSLDSDPPGANVYAFLLTRGGGGTHRPHAFSIREQTWRGEQECEERNLLGTCPIAPVSVPRGSYLLVFRRDGCPDLRVPVAIGRDTIWSGCVALPTEQDQREGFVAISAGPFWSGGDPQAVGASPLRARTDCGDFFIGQREVTWTEYQEFLEALRASGKEEEARSRSPRTPVAVGAAVRNPDSAGGRPVTDVSWDDAAAYCEWRTRRARSSGEMIRFALPDSAQWEKAARGVDGRRFPWGDGPPCSQGAPPTDQSVFGVLDMAGGVEEWVAGWYDRERGLREVRGGGGTDPDTRFLPCATRRGHKPHVTSPLRGFRVVLLPDEPGK